MKLSNKLVKNAMIVPINIDRLIVTQVNTSFNFHLKT